MKNEKNISYYRSNYSKNVTIFELSRKTSYLWPELRQILTKFNKPNSLPQSTTIVFLLEIFSSNNRETKKVFPAKLMMMMIM